MTNDGGIGCCVWKEHVKLCVDGCVNNYNNHKNNKSNVNKMYV